MLPFKLSGRGETTSNISPSSKVLSQVYQRHLPAIMVDKLGLKMKWNSVYASANLQVYSLWWTICSTGFSKCSWKWVLIILRAVISEFHASWWVKVVWPVHRQVQMFWLYNSTRFSYSLELVKTTNELQLVRFSKNVLKFYEKSLFILTQCLLRPKSPAHLWCLRSPTVTHRSKDGIVCFDNGQLK